MQVANTDKLPSMEVSVLESKVRDLEMTLGNYKEGFEYLLVLLDDIDTASDIFKGDYENLARYVYRKQQKRWNLWLAHVWVDEKNSITEGA